jgi:hypothetical protein
MIASLMSQPKRPDILAICLLLGYLIAGLWIAPQYGVNWDDPAQRDNGLCNIEYYRGNKTPLKNTDDKYHGPAFEIILVLTEKGLHLDNEHDIYLMRHVMVCLFYFFTLLVFYHLGTILFESAWCGLLGLAMLIFSPRIFGESLYNPKDIVFMGALVWAFYTMLLFIRRPNYNTAITHAFTCAFAMDVRIIGGLMVVLTGVHILLSVYQGRYSWRFIARYITVLVLVFLVFMIMMWPILLENPWINLYAAFQQLSNYSLWNGNVLYLGQIMRASALPWHYQWIWIAISTPEWYILFAILGTLIWVWRLPRGLYRDERYVTLGMCLFMALFPLLYRSITHAIVYDGWRHFYFVYPFILLLAVYGVKAMMPKKNLMLSSVITFLICLSFLWEGRFMVVVHPFQYCYFNTTTRHYYQPMNHWFEVDYWGLSYRQGYEYLSKLPNLSKHNKVSFQNASGYFNYCALDTKTKSMITIPDVNIRLTDYYLTTYRALKMPSSNMVHLHSLYADDIEVLGIYTVAHDTMSTH